VKLLRPILVFLLASLPVMAGKWSVDDILLAERAGDAAISKDGRLVVWVQSHMDKEKGEAVSNLVLKSLADDFEVTLTRGTDNNSSPRFSPDGKRIAFLSTRKPLEAGAGGTGGPGGAPEGGAESKGPQVWLLDIHGGEPWALTKFEKGVRALAWLDDDTLLLAAPEDPSLHDLKTKEKKDTSELIEDEENATPVRLFRFGIKSREARRLTENTDRIGRMFVSRDGTHAVTIHERSLRYIYDQKIRPVTYLHDLKTGSEKQLFADGKLLPSQVSWEPDGKGFYFSAPHTSDPVFMNATIQLVYRYDLASSSVAPVNLDWENGASVDLAATADGFITGLANGARPKLARYYRSAGGWNRSPIEGQQAGNIFSFDLGEDGKTVVYRYTTASVPSQLYGATLDGNALKNGKPVTKLNAGFSKKLLAKTELVYWNGARNEEVEGLLYYPDRYQAGKKYPLVVMIHGGPAGADEDAFSDSWAYPHNLMTERDAFVFKPNYHGSNQYGLKWVESISHGNYNELEWIDVEKGVDSLIAKGLVDPEKLGVMGWSNGSIITIEITTRTTRYKAASAGAGDVEWISDWGNAVFGHAFDKYYLGKTPLEDPQFYIKKSPLFRMDKVTTPTIIFFGTEDKQVPTEQGWLHYRALQQIGKTDVRFILFPGEPHGPRKYAHQRRKLDEELAWFDRYLFQTRSDEDRSLKPDSLLAAALRRRNMAEIPETVERGDLKIGRFEVTRVQYSAFDPHYKFGPGTEQYPASGISFEDAQRYCAWLSQKTGKHYRLGTEEEMRAHLKPGKGENTLDYWAGYAVNADDAARLAQRVESLGTGALLRPVGSFPGNGDDPIFDLGGNVAEWVTTKDGKGEALGGSADRPADAKSDAPARADYVGFRVVLVE